MKDRKGSEQIQGFRGELPPRGRRSAIPPLPEPNRYTMADLERETEFSARTIRYYITEGILPPAHGRGPTSTYDLGHLMRLRMIQRLKQDHVPLEEIKSRLGDLTDRDIATFLDIQTRPPEDRWKRVHLHPDLELHIRERAGRSHDPEFERAVEALIKFAETYLPAEDRR